jgi:nitrate/TMAO reductase-like tetraheme cytochrome c subunit
MRIRHLPKRKKLLLIGIMVIAIIMGFSIHSSHDYVHNNPKFCISCHIMDDAYEKWATSSHHLINCQECHHQGIKAKIHQVWFYVTQRPEAVVHHPELNHTICAQCHLSDDPQWKLIADTAGHNIHFKKAKIDCLECHMGGVHNFLRPVDACLNCHEDKVEGPGKKMAFAHCTDCHSFLSKKERLIPDRKTCLECHQKIEVEKESFPQNAPMASFDCSECHEPHKKIKPDREACLNCHEDTKVSHKQRDYKKSCTECHKPHIWTVH